MRVLAVLFAIFILISGGASCSIQHQPKQAPIYLTDVMRKHIWIDSSFSKEERNDIIRAYKTIECSTNRSLVVFQYSILQDLSDIPGMALESSIVVLDTMSTDFRIKESDKQFKKANKVTVGLFIYGPHTIPTVLLPRDRIKKTDKTLFFRIALHEAIHSALDIHTHSESDEAIMFPSIDGTSAKSITEDDLKFICEIYLCNASVFKTCGG